MSHHEHGVCVVFILLGLVCNFSLNVENNESRLVHLPREEFVKVMSDIISGGDKNTPSVVEESNDDEEFYDPMDPAGASWYQNSQRSTARSGTARSGSTKSSPKTVVEESPRTMATKQAQNAASGASMSETLAMPNASSGAAPRGRRVKSDSLYFLQRSMEAREQAYRSGVPLEVSDANATSAQANIYSGSV